jgi:hypothetical protein
VFAQRGLILYLEFLDKYQFLRYACFVFELRKFLIF